MTCWLGGRDLWPQSVGVELIPGANGRLRGDGPLPQYAGHALDEVTNGGFRHPVEERTIEGLANQTERRLIASAQPELAEVRTERGDLQLALECWEDSARPGGPPGDGQPCAAERTNGCAQLDLHPLAKLKRAYRETDLREQ